jgi:hypothetical protein
VQKLQTQKGAHTMALDTKTHIIYLSTAELKPPPAPTAENPHPVFTQQQLLEPSKS